MSDGSVFAYPKPRNRRPLAKDEPALEDAMGGFSVDDYRSMNGNSTDAPEILLQGGSLQHDFAPQLGGHFQMVQENEWSKIDAATMGMTPQQIEQFEKTGGVETVIGGKSTGTDTSSGSREKPSPTKRTAAQVVENLGNDFSSMKSTRLSDALRGAQENIIQQRMDAGANFGFQQTASTPQTTSNPNNPLDGINPFADGLDQSRAIDFTPYSQQFASNPAEANYEDLFNGNNLTGILTYFKDKK